MQAMKLDTTKQIKSMRKMVAAGTDSIASWKTSQSAESPLTTEAAERQRDDPSTMPKRVNPSLHHGDFLRLQTSRKQVQVILVNHRTAAFFGDAFE